MARKLGHYIGDAVFAPQIFGVGQKHRVEHGDSALRRRKRAKNVRLVCFWILQLKGVSRVSKSLLMLRKWCPGAESNHRHEDFQSTALPLSYPGMGTNIVRVRVV